MAFPKCDGDTQRECMVNQLYTSKFWRVLPYPAYETRTVPYVLDIHRVAGNSRDMHEGRQARGQISTIPCYSVNI